jgi:hypothetical protein
MDANTTLQLLAARDRAALTAAARTRAAQLRAEAQRDFITAIGRALRRAWTALRRAPAAPRC